MSDELGKWLNDRGYQALFMPTAEITPPELYNYFSGRGLRRMGDLKGYLSADAQLPVNKTGQLPNIQIVETKAKTIFAAARFLSGVLRTIGITSGPKLDISFAGKGDFVFKLLDVTWAETHPAIIVDILRYLRTDLIPHDYIESGTLHVAYHYAYARRLEMRRADKSKFHGKFTGTQIDDLLNVSAGGSARVEKGNALVFNAARGHPPIAFAYKAAELQRAGDGFEVLPGARKCLTGQPDARSGQGNYLPSPGLVLEVENIESG